MASTAAKGESRRSRSIGVHATVGLVAIVLLVGVFGGWAALANIASAAVAPGVIVVEGDVKRVQHPTGGVVGEIKVRNGDRVEAGDIVLRLDETVTRANLGVVQSQLLQLRGRMARLMAERDGAEDLVVPAEIDQSDVRAAAVLAGERRLLVSRREGRLRQKDQLGERIGQLRREIDGLDAQRVANEEQTKLIKVELEGVADLYRKKLVPLSRLTALQREAARLDGERGALIAQAARSGGQITEIELQILNLDQEAMTETLRDMRETDAQIDELVEREIAALDQLKRVDLRAPQSGIVHESQVSTVGGVIGPGEVVMQIVPTESQLAIEVRVSPMDVDQIAVGMPCTVRFAAFNQRTTPELQGSLLRIAADATNDERTGMSWFTARVTVPPEEMERIAHLQLLPGMPVEAHIRTGERSVISYLFKPLTDQFARTFREE
jgi:HlyD family secretion protein